MCRAILSFALLGLISGAVLPVSIGISRLHEFNTYVAAQPPGTALCGTPALQAWSMILFGPPFGAAIGTVAGLVCGTVYGSIERICAPVRPDGRPYKPD